MRRSAKPLSPPTNLAPHLSKSRDEKAHLEHRARQPLAAGGRESAEGRDRRGGYGTG